MRRTGDATRGSYAAFNDTRFTRNQVIIEAWDFGWYQREIAREVGMSISQVQRVIDKETARRQREAARAAKLA